MGQYDGPNDYETCPVCGFIDRRLNVCKYCDERVCDDHYRPEQHDCAYFKEEAE